MRTLRPNQTDDDVSTNKEYRLQEQIDALVNRVADLEDEVALSESELDAYKSDNRVAFDSGTLRATDISATEEMRSPRAVFNKAEISTTLSGSQANIDRVETERIEADSGKIDQISGDSAVFSGQVTADTIAANHLVVDTHSVDNETIGTATIGSADISEANLERANVSSLTSSEAEMDSLTSDVIRTNIIYADNVDSGDIKSHIVSVDDKVIADKDVYGLQQITSNTPVWIKLPVVNTGRYLLQVYNNDKTEWYFGVNVTWAGNNNATIQYSEKSWTEEPQYLGNTIYLQDGNLYFECRQSHSRILWRYETSDDNDLFDAPQTSGYLPVDPAYAESFKIKNSKGTIFTRYVQIGTDGSTGVLSLSPTSWIESTDTPVQYDTVDDVNFGFYAPDQDLDKGASPEFHTIKLDTEGKTVVRATEDGVIYTQEEASVNNGTLVPEPKLIEADDLFNYNGNSYALTQYEQNGSFTKVDVDVGEKKAKAVYAAPKSFKINVGGGYNSYPISKVYARSAYSNLDILYQNLNIQLLKEGETDPLADWTADSTEVITTAKDVINTPGYLVALELSRATFTSETAGNRRFTREIIRTEDGVEDYYWCVDDQSNIYGSDNNASYSAVRNFSNNAYTGAEPNITFKTDTDYLTYLLTLFDKTLLKSSTLELFIYEQNGSYFISTYSTSIEFSRTIQRINKVYQSLQEALDDIKNESYPVSTVNHTFALNSPVTTYAPLQLKNGKTLGVGKINPHPYIGIPNRWPCVINQTVYYFKKTFETSRDVIQDQSVVPSWATLENSDSNVKKYVYVDTVGYAEVVKSTSGSNTTFTIQYPAYMQKVVDGSFENWPNATYIYNTSSGLLTFATEFDLFTAPVTINKFEEIIVETPLWGKATWEDIDYGTTDHPITNLGDGTVVHGSETVGTDLTVRKNTVLGSAEGLIDPDTGDPIQTSVTVKGTSDFKKDVQVGDNNATADIKVKGGIYRYNNTLQDYEEIDSTYQRVEDKGQPYGYAPLDVNARIPRNYMPYDVMEYRGSWDAATGVFPQGTAQDPLQIGDTYKVSVAGTINGQYYGLGDEITYNGSTWDYYENNKVILGTTDLGVVGCMWLG